MIEFKCPVCGCSDYILNYNDVGEYRQCKECGVIFYSKENRSGSPAKDSGATSKTNVASYQNPGESVK